MRRVATATNRAGAIGAAPSGALRRSGDRRPSAAIGGQMNLCMWTDSTRPIITRKATVADPP